MKLQFSITFTDLYNNLSKVDEAWLKFLDEHDVSLYHALSTARSGQPLSAKEGDKLILQLAPLLEEFISVLFGIEKELKEVNNRYSAAAELYQCKRNFVQRDAVRSFKEEDLLMLEAAKVYIAEMGLEEELEFARFIMSGKADENARQMCKIYAGWAATTREGKEIHRNGVLFKVPGKINFESLLGNATNNGGTWASNIIHKRDGFKCTDAGVKLNYAGDQAGYCIKCHNQGKDSCSHGMKEQGGEFKKNALGVNLTGCPLEEKISQMNTMVEEASILGALSIITIDNPLAAATGHRICNDCMKGCIYQKQDAVDIPAIESRVLQDVLGLPWGFEIYSLLTRWNPLKFSEYLPKQKNGYKILVVGAGPAGFTASHYLLQSGYDVVAIDGLKIEPNKHIDLTPIQDISAVRKPLDERTPGGFGGVAEYGITVRWDKNNLTIIRTLLERREGFWLHGSTRFGSNITYVDAKALGFDHVVLAMGAGKPKILEGVANIMARGCKMASDFLMSLQSGGAFKKNSLVNLQIRLPVVVIGGGLTAIDTATEALAYYVLEVEKILRQYQELGDDALRSLSDEEKIIAEEFITHAKQLRESPDNRLGLIKSWGGVKIAYRRKLIDSPAYRLNHEEVELALSEGIEFIEHLVPEEIILDEYGAAAKIRFSNGVEMPARTVLIAAGTHPNTVLASEERGNFVLDGKYFRAIGEDGSAVYPEKSCKPRNVDVIMRYGGDGPSVSFLGDLHPSFSGNVVKAMASAKLGVPVIDKVVKAYPASDNLDIRKLNEMLVSKVQDVVKLAEGIYEIVVYSPLAAKNFRPGQFYRLQNYHADGLKIYHAGFEIGITEGIALTGAWVDREAGLIGMVVLEMGGSSDFCRNLKRGQAVSLMGPTGEPTEIIPDETVLLIGGGLGNAVLFSIGREMIRSGCKVLYFAGYKKSADCFKKEEIEAAADVVVWCSERGAIETGRKSDIYMQGNIIECMKKYDALGDTIEIKIKDCKRMIVIGSDGLMAAVAHARHNELKYMFSEDCIAIASINSPMQCMMKEICATCLQKHVKNGKEEYVYSCMNQDQNLDIVDFKHLRQRLKQNAVQEKLCKAYIERFYVEG